MNTMANTYGLSDYYLFGLPMTGRTYSSSDYRFAFNGMEKEDEVYGEGNFYDFGARMYDARIGRWTSVDPKFKLQPDQSPYKSFLNNPIIFVDPEGETEYITIITMNEETGETTIECKTSSQVMTDGVVHAEPDGGGGYTNYNYYYDYSTTIIRTTDKNGKQLSETTTSSMLKDRGVKNKDGVFFGGDDYGDTQSNWAWSEMTGGYNFTWSLGQGQETRKAFHGIETVDAELLMAAFGAASRVAGERNLKNIAEPIKVLVDSYEAGGDIIDGLIGLGQEVYDAYKSEMDKMNKETTTSSGGPVRQTGDTLTTTKNGGKDTVKVDIYRPGGNRRIQTGNTTGN